MEQKKQTNFIKEAISWAVWLAVFIGISYCINSYVIVNANVISGSMETTVMTNDRVLGLRFAYLFSEPARSDVIAFDSPLPQYDAPFVKRIIGLPGETVEIIDGKVFINGASGPLVEDYLHEPMHGSFGPYTVPENSYFVMGDNRNDSYDSRGWGFVPFEHIQGKVYIDFGPHTKLLH